LNFKFPQEKFDGQNVLHHSASPGMEVHHARREFDIFEFKKNRSFPQLFILIGVEITQ
jgi:hypothetical protein